MFGLPVSTQTRRIIPKDRLKLAALAGEIERVSIMGEMTEETVNLPAGEVIRAFYIVHIALRVWGHADRIIMRVAKAIPQRLVFVVEGEDGPRYAAVFGGRLYQTNQEPNAHLVRDIGAVYEDIVAQIAGVQPSGTLEATLERRALREGLKKKIAVLEKKALSESQPRRKWELAEETKMLKNILSNT